MWRRLQVPRVGRKPRVLGSFVRRADHVASPPRRSLLLLDTRCPRKGSCTRAASRPRARGLRQGVLHTGCTRTANSCLPLGGGLAHGPANERRRTTTKRCCVPTRAQSRRRRSMGYGRTGRPPRQRGRRLPPPMQAWLTQPHGRRHKAPPQPCALTTSLMMRTTHIHHPPS